MSVETQENVTVAAEPSAPEAATPQVEQAATAVPDPVPAVAEPEAPSEPAPEPAVAEEPPMSEDDLASLLPDPSQPLTLENGLVVQVRDLRLKEFLAMLKIVTRGASVALNDISLDVSDPNFAQNLIGLFVFAIPEASDEAAQFCRIMVEPVGPFKNEEAEGDAYRALDTEFANPELGDVIDLITLVVRRESKDIQRLGKRLGNAIQFARRVNAV